MLDNVLVVSEGNIMPSSRWQEQNLIDEEALTLKKVCFGLKNYLHGCPKEYENFFQDCAKISLFLQDTDAVLNQLRTLNTLLVAEANKRGVPFSDDDNVDALKHHKVLRSVLEHELHKIGFAPNLGKALDVLELSTFKKIFSKGLLLKDPGAGLEHGEFTHPIQWLLIGLQQKDTPILTLPILKIFNTFGHGDNYLLIWSVVVDLLKEACYDARSPERLHRMILNSDDPDLELLKILCHSRIKKRVMNLQSTFFSEKKLYPNKEYIPSDDKNLLYPLNN